MDLNKWFDRGISKEQYMESLQKHRDNFLHIYNHFEVPSEDDAFLKGKNGFRIIVLAEEWCGHCMLDIPILLHIAERADIPVKFLPRDENLELMDQYLTNEKRYIPIVIFIDESGKEIGKWGPMAPEISDYVDTLKEDLPPREAPNYEEAFRGYIAKIGDSFRNDTTFWNYVYEDIKKALP